MSRNRIYQLTPTAKRAKPTNWTRQAAAAIADAKTRVTPSSWWTAHARPDDRDGFMAAAHDRHAARERKRFALTYRGNIS